MKVLMLSTDASILNQGFVAQERMLEYAKLFEELHVVVYEKATGDRRQATSIGNLFLYSTNTNFRLAYFWQAYKIGCLIIRNFLATRDLPLGEKLVITTQDPFEAGLVGVWLKNKFKVPLQVQCHVDFLNRYFWRESLKNKLRTILAKFVLGRADGIRVVSERIVASLVACRLSLVAKIIVLPIFVDIKKIMDASIKTNLHRKYMDYDFIILMASRLSREKNIELAIASMKDIILKYSRTLLLIVGDGEERNNLEIRIKKYEVSKNVIIEPWINDLISYYKTADLFLLTSNYEGYGRTIIEAIAAGLPVVATDVGVAPQVVARSGGLLAPVGDKEALSGAILEMIRRKEQGNLNAKNEVIKEMPSHDEYLRLYKESLEKLMSRE